LEYYEQYEAAPNNDIENIYQSKVRKKELDDELADSINDFLMGISDEYDQAKFNSAYLLDNTVEHFRIKALHVLADDIRDGLRTGVSVSELEENIIKYQTPERRIAQGIDPLADMEAIQTAWEAAQEPLFEAPGALGRVISKMLTRDALIGIQGPEKRGKTFWLWEFATWAYHQGCNVAIFQAGDMSQNQGLLRLHARLSGQPYLEEFCRNLRCPVMDCDQNQKDVCNKKYRAADCGVWDEKNERNVHWEQAPSDYVPCTNCRGQNKDFVPAVWYKRMEVEPLGWREAYRNAVKLAKRQRKVKMRLFTYPNSTLTVRELNSVLNSAEEFEGFIPDVVIIDYVDIMAAESNTDRRHAEDEKWRTLRALSQNRNICVITATQADADSYTRETQNMGNFSESKSKYGHLTGMLTLNQTDYERAMGLMRLGVLLVREGETPAHQVKCLECRSIGRVCVDSYI
jgi:hypothetical protein